MISTERQEKIKVLAKELAKLRKEERWYKHDKTREIRQDVCRVCNYAGKVSEKNIKTFMENMNIKTKAQLAQKFDLTPAQSSNIVDGNLSMYSISVLLHFCRKTGLTPNYVLGWEPKEIEQAAKEGWEQHALPSWGEYRPLFEE